MNQAEFDHVRDRIHEFYRFTNAVFGAFLQGDASQLLEGLDKVDAASREIREYARRLAESKPGDVRP